uniref:Uncharacterized protein n=2 Tax=Physcomitrium patens TaxID=3218 RepID=A0A7I3ZRB3_PHYPA
MDANTDLVDKANCIGIQEVVIALCFFKGLKALNKQNSMSFYSRYKI